jgi:hypothetical protein
MTMADADFMLTLKNYPETRKFAILSHDEIKREDHIKWLEKNLQYFQVIEDILDGSVVVQLGAIRLQNDEISIWVHRTDRSKGVATKVLQRLPGKWTAKIVDGNVPSFRSFVKAGFLPVDHIANYYVLHRNNTYWKE